MPDLCARRPPAIVLVFPCLLSTAPPRPSPALACRLPDGRVRHLPWLPLLVMVATQTQEGSSALSSWLEHPWRPRLRLAAIVNLQRHV